LFHNTGPLTALWFLPALEERFADIFFLVDSGMSPADFQQVRALLTRLVNQMNIGASAYRLGLAQYGPDIRVEFLLSAIQTKEDTQTAVKRFRQRRLQPGEPRKLGSALEFASTNFFTSEAGSRAAQGYRQFLVVISGKDSDDPMYKESRLIKSSGVTVVGMSLGASMQEMRVVATAPHTYQSIATVPALRAIFEREEMETILTGGTRRLYLTPSLTSFITLMLCWSIAHLRSEVSVYLKLCWLFTPPSLTCRCEHSRGP